MSSHPKWAIYRLETDSSATSVLVSIVNCDSIANASRSLRTSLGTRASNSQGDVDDDPPRAATG